MTKELFLKELIESNLLVSIDLAPAFKEFIYDRINTLSVPTVSEEYRRYEKEKRELEEIFVKRFADPSEGRERINRYIDVNSHAESLSNFHHYEKGFYEGVRTILLLIAT